MPSWHAGEVTSPTVWSTGRYEAVAERIAPIADEVIDAVERRVPVRDATLIDLACGTGSAALAAAARGARLTAVDITPELVAIGARKAEAAGRSIAWVTADASDTGLPEGSFDAAISNMGTIFVEPASMVAELSRLVRSGGVLGFSSWKRGGANPFFDPIVEVLGPPPASGHSPDQWGQSEVITERLTADFDDIDIETGAHTWGFASVTAGVHFVTNESPMHVSMLGGLDAARRDRLLAAFEAAWQACRTADGGVSFDAPYVVVTARRR